MPSISTWLSNCPFIIPVKCLPHGLQMGSVFLLLIIICQFLHLFVAFRIGLNEGSELYLKESALFFLGQPIFVYLIKVCQDAVGASGIEMCFRLLQPFGIPMGGSAGGKEQESEEEERRFHGYAK